MEMSETNYQLTHLVLMSYVDTNLLHDMVTGRPMMAVLHLLNQTPTKWFSKKQLQWKLQLMDQNSLQPGMWYNNQWDYKLLYSIWESW